MLRRLKRKSGGQRPLLKTWISPIGLLFIVGSAIAGTGWWQARKSVDHPTATAALPSIPSSSTQSAAAASPSVAEPRLPTGAATSPSVAEPRLPTEATASDTVAKESMGPPPKAPSAKRRGATARETTAARAAATTSDDPIPSPPPAQDGEDPTPVVRAIRALRSERNPARAEQLLQQYLRTNPDGALAEDAQALLIETASALRSPSAADRATRYLELYPNGRYRATARRVLSARP